MKLMNIIMILIVVILCIMSLIAFTTVNFEMYDKSFSFSIVGFENYLFSFGKYKYLFTGTIAVCSAYFGLLRVQTTIDSNEQRVKQDIFNEWKLNVQIRCSEIEEFDPKMTREIIKIRRNLFDIIYKLKFHIENKNQLIQVLENNLTKDLVSFFEQTNKKSNNFGCVYENKKHTYSFLSFSFVFFGMINGYYDELEKDLLELYISKLPPTRKIDSDMYERMVNKYG